jgi:LysM repeat protein
MTTPVGSSPGPYFPTEPLEGTYVVRSGDTLSGIARRFGLTLADVLKANPLIKDPNRIQVGQQLKLPVAGSPLRGAERPAADNARGIDVFERKAPPPARTEAASPRSVTAAPAEQQGATGSSFFSKIKAFFGGLFGTGKAETPTPIGTAPGTTSGPRLNLGPNERYRDAIVLGSQRTGIDPAALAALINAEAAKVKGPALNRLTDEAFYARHPELNRRPLTKADTELIKEWRKIQAEMSGTWDPASAATSSSALGLTQFLKKTWLEQAETPGTYLNKVAKERGLVGEDGLVVPEKTADVLALRTDPTLSIVAAADYGRSNLDALDQRGLVAAGISDDEKAKLMYLAHHEGLAGAASILNGTLSEARATELLEANVLSASRSKDLIDEHGSAAKAYKAWLLGYIDAQIQPARYR